MSDFDDEDEYFPCEESPTVSILRTIELWHDEYRLDELPEDIRRSFSPSEMRAYADPEGYFRERAAACAFPPLRQFLELLGSEPCVLLHLYGGKEPIYSVYFGVNLRSTGRFIQVRLASGVALPGEPPPELAMVYREFGGIIDGREYVGGWNEPEDVKSIRDLQWEPNETAGFTVERSYPIYSHGNGDYLGYGDHSRGFLYDHERHSIEGEDLIDFLGRYFGDYGEMFS